MPHFSGPRIMLGLGITVVTLVWLLAIATRKVETSAKLYQAGYVIAGWFVFMTVDLYVGTGRRK
jgi:hypothetical protein